MGRTLCFKNFEKFRVHLQCMENKFSGELYGYTTSAIPRHLSPVKGKLYKDSFTPVLRTETLGFRTRFQLLVASKPWFRKSMCQEKKAKQKKISLSSHFSSEE